MLLIGYMRDKFARKLLLFNYLIVYGAEERKFPARILILKLRPQYTRSVEKLNILIKPDPLFSLRHSRFITGFGGSFSCERINECRLSDIGDTDYHCAYGPVHYSAFFVALKFFTACSLYGWLYLVNTCTRS